MNTKSTTPTPDQLDKPLPVDAGGASSARQESALDHAKHVINDTLGRLSRRVPRLGRKL